MPRLLVFPGHWPQKSPKIFDIIRLAEGYIRLNLLPQYSEKNNDMRNFSRSKIHLVLALAIGVVLAPFKGFAGDTRTSPNVNDARDLFKIEKQYFEERTQSRWDEIYKRQHPELKKRVTQELFINRDGMAGYDTVDLLQSRKAGGLSILPPPSDVVTTPRDALGFPTSRKYRIIANPWVKIKKHRYDRVLISPDGRYARVDVKLDVDERLPPHLFRVDLVVPHTREHFDYWEKVDGNWVVALMVHRLSLSGGKIPVTFLPKKMDELDKIEWIEFDPKKLETQEVGHE